MLLLRAGAVSAFALLVLCFERISSSHSSVPACRFCFEGQGHVLLSIHPSERLPSILDISGESVDSQEYKTASGCGSAVAFPAGPRRDRGAAHLIRRMDSWQKRPEGGTVSPKHAIHRFNIKTRCQCYCRTNGPHGKRRAQDLEREREREREREGYNPTLSEPQCSFHAQRGNGAPWHGLQWSSGHRGTPRC